MLRPYPALPLQGRPYLIKPSSQPGPEVLLTVTSRNLVLGSAPYCLTALSHFAGSYVLSRACLTLSLSLREEHYTRPTPDVYSGGGRFSGASRTVGEGARD